jgi:hypothetical protein
MPDWVVGKMLEASTPPPMKVVVFCAVLIGVIIADTHTGIESDDNLEDAEMTSVPIPKVKVLMAPASGRASQL